MGMCGRLWWSFVCGAGSSLSYTKALRLRRRLLGSPVQRRGCLPLALVVPASARPAFGCDSLRPLVELSVVCACGVAMPLPPAFGVFGAVEKNLGCGMLVWVCMCGCVGGCR